jgi:hypothetical protein
MKTQGADGDRTQSGPPRLVAAGPDEADRRNGGTLLRRSTRGRVAIASVITAISIRLTRRIQPPGLSPSRAVCFRGCESAPGCEGEPAGVKKFFVLTLVDPALARPIDGNHFCPKQLLGAWAQ